MKLPVLLVSVLFFVGVVHPAEEADLSRCMPQKEDFTSMWWRAGYPAVVPGAPWHRCISTETYALVQDTKTLTIPHLGKYKPGRPVSEPGPAELELKLSVNGKTYFARSAQEVSRFVGPRIIESGKFLQRADVTNLIFTAEDGSVLNQESRLETVAWGDRLGFILSARPGRQSVAEGEKCFGIINGGYGLTGANRFDVPGESCDTPETFRLSFHAFVPTVFKADKHSPWLVCKNAHEQKDGNYGIVLDKDAVPTALINIGGGRDNSYRIKGGKQAELKREQWNHLAISYDSKMLRLYVNGHFSAELQIEKKRNPVRGGLCFGDRQDGFGKGAFRFRGAVDEIKLFDRALSLGELRRLSRLPDKSPANMTPLQEWSFRSDVAASAERISEEWTAANLELRLSREGKELKSNWQLPEGETWLAPHWQEAAITFFPDTFQPAPPQSGIDITATEKAAGRDLPVSYEPKIGWHKINLDGIVPLPPDGVESPGNDAMERVSLRLHNRSEKDQAVRLMFEKTARGIRQRIGTPITGISAILRDAEGNPTGIPVQLSKNWHVHREAGTYSGSWFHGISVVHLPKGTHLDLELVIVYGHWGGLPAASHAQLSLIGWGNNQLWHQSALGSWGESICYDPDQHNAGCTITDVRPVLVSGMKENARWNWTHNHGGGDFFRFFDPAGERVPHARVRIREHRQGPCLTEVTYSGEINHTGIFHHSTVSLARSDDMVCGTYQLQLNVTKPVEFSRFVLFQIGADTYLSTREKKFAVGNEKGLITEWDTEWGGDNYKGEPVEARIHSWASLHDAFVPEGESGARANRGIILRSWEAKIGGKEIYPQFAEHGAQRHRNFPASTMDLILPPDIKSFAPGDYIKATIEHFIVPRLAEDYYGPDEELRAALERDQNTWKMIHRQAVGDQISVIMNVGRVIHQYPDVRIKTVQDRAEFVLDGGIGYVPLTFENLSSPDGYILTLDGVKVDQSVHGNDFWQTDYNPVSKMWSQTYNIRSPRKGGGAIRFGPDN
ncbi:MAG: hypothetical protein P1V20_02750 [Verrucomicrobiales bacterium]|nr:hypothetical protein [Verrucomicrobiales bacterium]